MNRRQTLSTLALAASTMLSSTVFAQSDKPLKVIVGFPQVFLLTWSFVYCQRN
jgi:hypothetical protein